MYFLIFKIFLDLIISVVKQVSLWLLLRVWCMKVKASLKTLRLRDKNCQLVKRKGRLYIINKKNPKFKAKQG